MSSMKMYLGPATTISLVLALGACSATPDDAAGDPVDQTQQEIINGTDVSRSYDAVALYHKMTATCAPNAGDKANGYTQSFSVTNVWWPRPCSGMVIRKDGDVHYIVTARHCVTEDGTVAGRPFTGSTSMKSISTLSPGVLATTETNGSLRVLGSPPSASRDTSVYYQNDATFGDIAIVKTTGNLMPTGPVSRPGFRGISDFSAARKTLTVHGYGRSQPGDCYTHATSGAGTLRAASTFVVEASDWMSFLHEERNGAELTHGDSGGPLFEAKAFVGSTAFILYGVNSTAAEAAGGANLADFFQTAFGNIYLTPEAGLALNHVVIAPSPADGSRVYVSAVADNAAMKVQRSGGYLRFGNYCLNDEGSDAPVRLRACGGPNTHWKQTGTGAILNTATARCLKASGPDITSSPCNGPTTGWAFSADASFAN